MGFDPMTYDMLERAASSRLCNRIIEASQCQAFGFVGYPTRVSSEQELWRYADVMQEHRARKTYDLLGALSLWEFGMIERLTDVVRKQTAQWGHEVTPTASPLRALLVYREIAALFPSNAKVIEIGPGSGYLSAMLAMNGAAVYSVEVAQAFALWQRHLSEWLLCNWNHIFWWDWFRGNTVDKVHVITANHCLNELHANALHFLVRRAEEILTEDGALIFESLGSEVVRRNIDTLSVFQRRGWRAEQRNMAVIMIPPNGTFRQRDSVVTTAKGWADLENLWGGEPRTPDESFLDYCGTSET